MPSVSLLLTVVGARPQFIKSAALSRVLAGSSWKEHLVHAGQHSDDHMGTDFLVELPAPAVNYPFQVEDRAHGRHDEGIRSEIRRVRPEVVLVYGDTDAPWRGPSPPTTGVPLFVEGDFQPETAPCPKN